MTAKRTAFSFNTGSMPGMARSTALAWLLGVAPNVVAEPEKILESVASCTWTSSPITVSQLMAVYPRSWLSTPAHGCLPPLMAVCPRSWLWPVLVPVGDLLVLVGDVQYL